MFTPPKFIPITNGYLAIAEQISNNQSLMSCLEHITPQWFSCDYWQQLKAIEGSSKGRYTTWFIHHLNQHWVLRHYWRGGFIANFSKDSYIYTGLKRTRGIAELTLLQSLYKEGFPVPQPIAAKVIRKGLFYHCDILIERIPNAQDLVAYLSQSALTNKQWHVLGECIAKFHRHGVYHADLNAKNILLSPEGFHLIDFDRGEIRPVDLNAQQNKWQQANLARLHRSFLKEKGKQPNLEFSEDNWQQLLVGYKAFL